MAIEIRGLCTLLQVFDMERSVGFYHDVLGFEIQGTSKPDGHFYWALLRLNGLELMLNAAYEDDERPAAPDSARVTAHEDTAIYFSCPDVDAAYKYLRRKGVSVKKPKVAPYGM